jgi:O-antigen/teichoic acid export membrane protein
MGTPILRRTGSRQRRGRIGSSVALKLPLFISRNAAFMRLVRGGGSVMALNVAGMAQALLLQIVLARLLGHEGYGQFAYVMAWINILVYVAVMGHDSLAMRSVAAHHARQEWALLAGVLRHATILVGTLSIALSGLGAFLIWTTHEVPGELAATFLAGFVVLPLLALLRLNASVLYGQGRVVLGTAPERLGRDAVVLALTGMAVLIAAPLTPPTVMGFVAIGGGGALVLILYLRRRIGVLPPDSPRAVYMRRQWIASAFVLGLTGGSQLLLQRSDVLMIGWLMTAADAGVYVVACNVAELVLFPFLAVSSIVAPSFAAHYARGERSEIASFMRTTTLSTLAGSLLIGIPLFALAPWILGMFGPEFVDGANAARILMLGICLRAVIGPSHLMLTMTGHERHALWALGCAAAANIALNLVMIPAFGIEGAASMTTLALLGSQVAMAIMAWRLIGVAPALLPRLLTPRAGRPPLGWRGPASNAPESEGL